MNRSSITPEELAEFFTKGETIDLIDVRTPAEYNSVHVEFAKNVPLERLEKAEELKPRRNSPNNSVYVICQSGNRGRQACEKLRTAGFTNVFNVEGGTLACIAAGIPVVRGKMTISLERQVRIVAGSLVIIGILLGRFVHPAFVGLSAFVGAGLVFAGVSDTCAMGLLLARMPWNQTASTPHSAIKKGDV